MWRAVEGNGVKVKHFVGNYIEEVSAEAAIDALDFGKMMTKRAYVAWAAKPKNGGMDAEEAEAD